MALIQAQPIQVGNDRIGNAHLNLYYADKKKDQFPTAEKFIQYFENVANTNNWQGQARKAHFLFALRGEASNWADNIPKRQNFEDNFEYYKRLFLQDFGERVSEQDYTYILKDLKFQKNGNPFKFGNKISRIFSSATDKKAPPVPKRLQVLRDRVTAINIEMTQQQGVELYEAIKQTILEERMIEREEMTNFYGQIIYTGHLYEEYGETFKRDKPTDLFSAIDSATKEFVNKGGDVRDDTIENKRQIFEINSENQDNEIDAIQRKQFQSRNNRGRGNFRGNYKGNRGNKTPQNNNQNNQTKPTNQNCRYCKNNSHRIEGCNKRISDGFTVLNKETGRYEKRINVIEDTVASVKSMASGFHV